MSDAKRLTVSLDQGIYKRLVNVTEKRKPRLPKRYVIELALKRLLDDLDGGQLELELNSNDR